jgi:protein TonB
LAPAPLTDSAAPPTAPPPARTGDGPAATPPEAISQNRAPPPSGPAQPPADPAPSAGAPAADQKPPPAFVKPPEGPSEAATQKQRNDPANALTAPPADQPPPPPPAAAATPVLAAPEAAADAVPTGDQAKAAATATAAPSAQDKPPDATAQLQAALPMDLAGLPMSFRAVLSGPGAAPIIDYAGLVNDKLGQSVNALIGEAIRQHLKGQVVLSYSVGDAGQITVLQLVHSSGSAKLDQLALDMVRRSAPLPPPPAGAQRQFRKALMFGGQ